MAEQVNQPKLTKPELKEAQERSSVRRARPLFRDHRIELDDWRLRLYPCHCRIGRSIFLAFAGTVSWPQVFGDYILPVLVGNVVGGVSLVTALNHAQVVS